VGWPEGKDEDGAFLPANPTINVPPQFNSTTNSSPPAPLHPNQNLAFSQNSLFFISSQMPAATAENPR